MPRKPRTYLKSSFFHVITQGINKSYIFDKEEDIKYYIKNMYELLDEHPLKIIAYCIMNNHAHILIETDNINELSKYMQRLNTKYGRYFNKKYSRVGYVFRDRYKSEGIYNEVHLYNCIKYIYNNPVKAGICLKPEDYPYSNYKKISKNIENKNYLFIDVEETDYKEIVRDYLKEKDISFFDVQNNKKEFAEVIRTLKNEYKIPLRKIAEELNIGRETIRRIYKN